MTDQDILDLALEHFTAATANTKPSENGRWSVWASRMRKVIGTFKTPTEVLRYAQHATNVPFSHREKSTSEFIKSCSSLTCLEFPWLTDKLIGMRDNPNSRPETIPEFSVDGKQYYFSNMFFWHVWSLFTCQSYVPEISSIIEIGGGDGALARLWCLYFSISRYVIVDLPESLYFSEVCLREVFGDDVGYAITSIPDTTIVLVPADRIDIYRRRSDLVVSIGSIQEMDDDTVDHYMRWLDRYDARYFYSLNYAAHQFSDMHESRCWWGPRPSSGWSTKILSFDPALIHFMCDGRHFLQALYKKERSKNSLRHWSVLRGRFLTLETYIEGLDLLRQNPTAADIKQFVEIVLSKWPIGSGLIPKEIIALTSLIPQESEVIKFLKGRIKGARVEMSE